MTVHEPVTDLIVQAEARLGVTFAEPTLLLTALTHRSYLNEQSGWPGPSNERLEFLGDAVLGLVVGEHLYQRYPEAPEGDLTKRRSTLIRSSTLARWARQCDLAPLIRLGFGEASGDGVRDAVLADVFEAVLAAVYLDKGLAAVATFLQPFLNHTTHDALHHAEVHNPKGHLQELVQRHEHRTPAYVTVAAEGPDHAVTFTVEVYIGERVLGRGAGRSKQEAQQAAAREALENYGAGLERGGAA